MHYSPCRWPVKGQNMLESRWNVMAHGDAREGKWRGNRRMEWVAITLPTTSEHGVSSITNADAHNSAASSRLNWNPRRFKWTRPSRRRTKSGFCACAITFQLASTRTVRKVTPNNGSGPLPQKVGHAFLKKKVIGIVWTGFIWLMIRTNGGLLWTRYWTFGLPESGEFSRLP